MSTTTRIYIPTPLRPYAGNVAAVEVHAATAGEALRELAVSFQRGT